MTHTPFGTCWWSGAAEIRKTQERTAQYVHSAGLFWHERHSNGDRLLTKTKHPHNSNGETDVSSLQGEMAELFVPQLLVEAGHGDRNPRILQTRTHTCPLSPAPRSHRIQELVGAASNRSPNARHGSVCRSGTPALLGASPEPLREVAAPCLCRHVGNSLPVSRPRPCQLKPSSSLITSPPPPALSRQTASLAACNSGSPKLHFKKSRELLHGGSLA